MVLRCSQVLLPLSLAAIVIFSVNGLHNSFVPTTFRLPNDSLPLSYDLTLKSAIHRGDLNFAGNVKICVRIENETDKIVLNYRKIAIDWINLLTPSANETIAKNLTYETLEKHEFLIVQLPAVSHSGDELVLSIAYRGRLSKATIGFFYGTYLGYNQNPVYYAATQFETIYARHAMPCYDEPAKKAPISLSIVHGKDFRAIANTEVISQHPYENDSQFVITKFAATPPIQTYLLAFSISDFDSINGTDSRISQRIYANPMEIAKGTANFAASVVGPILRGLEDFLGVEYPYSKLDHLALTLEYFGAMENIGLQIYNEEELLYTRDIDKAISNRKKLRIVRYIAHETSHQFFGDLVSPSWWSFAWLNEGLATLFESLMPSIVYPEYDQMSYFFTRNYPNAFARDSRELNAWSMNQYAENSSDLWTKFNSIGYEKSGCVMRMFMEVMTERTFAKGLNLYLRDMYFKAATPDDLHRNLQAAYDNENSSQPLDIGELMGTWENQAGYPLITVTIEGDDLLFSQRRYPTGNGEIYAVPLTLTTNSSRDFETKTPNQWLMTENASFPQDALGFNATNNDWIVVNIQQVGYYRVDYCTVLWHALIAQLNDDPSVINSLNRAVLQDEIALAWKDLNRVTAGDVLSMLSYFDREDEPIAWSKAEETLNLLYFKLFTTECFANFLSFINDITSPHLAVVGFEAIEDEHVRVTDLRHVTRKWNCAANNGDCLRHEFRKFQYFYRRNKAEMWVNLCAAMRKIKNFQKVLTHVIVNTTVAHRGTILRHMGCTLNANDLKFLFEALRNFSNILTVTDRAEIIAETLNASPTALSAVMDFIEEDIYGFVDLFTSSSLSDVLTRMAHLMHAESYVKQYKRIITTLLDDKVLTDSSFLSLTKILAENQKWMETNYDEIASWLAI